MLLFVTALLLLSIRIRCVYDGILELSVSAAVRGRSNRRRASHVVADPALGFLGTARSGEAGATAHDGLLELLARHGIGVDLVVDDMLANEVRQRPVGFAAVHRDIGLWRR